MIEIGCQTYSLRSRALPEMLASLRKAGFRGMELWAGHADFGSGAEGAVAVRDAVREIGLTIEAYSAGGFVTVGLEEVESRLESAFGYARALGVDLVTGVVDRRALPMIDALCRRTGMRFGVENHWYADFARVGDFADVLRASPLVGVTLDTGHLVMAGDDPVEAVDALGPRLFAVHLKDVILPRGLGRLLRRRRLRCCGLGAGDGGVESFLAALTRAGFRGSVALEDERPGLPLSDLQESLRAGTRMLRAMTAEPAQPQSA